MNMRSASIHSGGWPGATTAALATPAEPVLADGSACPQGQPGILLLDDDSFILGIQARMLRSMGYTAVASAGSAEAAMMRLQREPQAVDVIVCDLNMPGMDGIEFLQLLNARPTQISVILLSGEGARIMHSVRKLLCGGQLVILGALEKPAARAGLRALLDLWKPPAAPTPAVLMPSFTEADLRAAHDHGQWVLHYQPKVDLKTGTLAGMEALVRWQHPAHGLVYPDCFIGAAEDCGVIDALTDWVLQAALKQLVRWHGQGLQIHMAVNLSMENLREPGFARRVDALVRDTSVSPRDLTLEITESRLMSTSSAPLESLVRLRLQGFGLAIDDFGTGHSSLVQLRDVPFSELKVDRGFVQSARHNQIIRPILEGSIGIAKRLGIRSVAEGVETEDDWELMRELGCDLAQGHFIGRPMACHRVPQWFELWQARRTALVRP